MGFPKIFAKIGTGLARAFKTVGNSVKKVAVEINSHVLKPVYQKAIVPLYKKAIVPVANRTVSFVSHTIDRAERVADAGAATAEGLGGLTKTLSNSPALILGVLGLGALFLSRK